MARGITARVAEYRAGRVRRPRIGGPGLRQARRRNASACGGFSGDGSRWVSFQPNDLPVKALSRRFRTLLCKAIRAAARQGKLERLPDTISIEGLIATAMAREWSVYAKPPFGGPARLLRYLAQYTHRVAITNERIVSYENHEVTFLWRDYRDGNTVKTCTLDGREFLRRFLMHVPPTGFVRIRSYGFLGNRNRKRNIERARQLIGKTETPFLPERFRPLRLCPECSDSRRAERTPRFARPDLVPQFDLPRRPPPIPVAA